MGDVIKFPTPAKKDGSCPSCGTAGPKFEVMMVGEAPKILSGHLEVTYLCRGCGVEVTQKFDAKF